jgi:hypothetical protein
MEETAFDVDARQLAETSRRFPARRLVPAVRAARGPAGGVGYLDAASGAEFVRHAWDEAGRI